ncbi:MAG: transporter substrate-binding domain-containing protein [Limibacillus sp.]
MFRPLLALAIFPLSLIAAIFCAPALSAGTLETVQNRGYVRCAIGNRQVGDTRIGETGYVGFFPEFCRNVAVAIFNDRNAVQLSPTLIRHGLQSISQGDVDIYVSNVTWTFSRDMKLRLTPAAVLYYDGQGFMSHAGMASGPLSEHQPARVCVSRSTTTIANLQDYIAIHNLDWEILAFESSEGRNDAFFSGKCDLLTTDALALAFLKATAVDDPANYVLHQEIISKEPLVAYVRDDDMVWGNLVRWTVNATILAEEKGITKANYLSFLDSEDPSVRRLLGVDITEGTESIGLDPLWARNIIASSGNYGEIFDRYLGNESAIGVERGSNKLWSDGGLLFSPPFR